MSITPQFLDQLRARLPLSDVIGQRIKIQRAGREYKACCPFHKEKTPSFTINDDKQFYHCFGCGAHGDVISFVTEHDNLSFIEAVELLAAKAGMQVPKSSPEEVRKAKEQKSLYSLMDHVARWYQNALYDARNKEILTYLLERGLSESAIAAFRIGYAPDNQEGLRDSLLKEGYTDSQIIESGVYRKSKHGKDPYPFMRDRVMFPVADRRGRIVAFGGRVLPDHLAVPSRSGYTPPKYLNSSETPIFHKGRMLYGESHARQAAGEGQDIIIVEGYMDVIACHQAGLKGAVAPLGTALTEDQVHALWQMIPKKPKLPILCFDGDAAGLQAAERACERILPLLQSDQSVRFSFLPKGEDPDSLIKSEGRKAFESRLHSALSMVDFIWNRAISGRNFETPEARAGLEKKLESQILKISDRSLQHYYRQVIREKLRNAFAARKTVGPSGWKDKNQYRPKTGGALQAARPQQPYQGHSALREKILLAVLINHPNIYPSVEDELEIYEASDNRFDHLRQEIMSYIAYEDSPTRENIIDHLKVKGFQREIELILNENVYIHAGFARKDREDQEALEGWHDIWSLIEGQKAVRELKSAGRQMAQELSNDKEDHFFHLVRQHEKSVQKP